MLLNGRGEAVQTTLPEAAGQSDPGAVWILSHPLLVDHQHYVLGLAPPVILNHVNPLTVAVIEQEGADLTILHGTPLNDLDVSLSRWQVH